MVNASYDGGQGQANGPSVHPAPSRSGRLIFLQSSFTNRIAGWETGGSPRTDGLPTVVVWYYSNQRDGQPLQNARLPTIGAWVSWPGEPPLVEGSNTDPAMSSRGNHIGFTSDGSGHFGESNGPGISDVFAIYQRETVP